MTEWDELKNMWQMGYEVGEEVGRKTALSDIPAETMSHNDQISDILTDLIAELRDTADVKPGATGRLLREMAGSAEARLREVGRS